MRSFWRVLSAERLKMSKSHIWLLVIGSPAVAVLLGALANMQEDGQPVTWEVLLSVMSLIHAMLFLPVLSGVFAALICRAEHADGGWKLLLALPVTRTSVYLAKYTMVMVLLAAVQLLFFAVLLGVGLLRGVDAPVPWALLLSSIFGGWLACLPLAALQLAVSQSWNSFGAPLALNVSLTIPNILIANSVTYGPYYPWVQPMLAMSPFGGDRFGAFNLPIQSLMIVVFGSLALFLAAGLLSFWRKAV
ncbi:ABC transporter permease [Paenibacillus sp. S150]|uniref:ABC transporter permease n=1 Tax=Paenibacillus sp. S150 TaxID=2749826 RepID=UPI001C58B04E|nr:ABC transporter permease [Paenibacillus sp. S150]MBW4085309.1 ABC transporter permease [Paenibacillus sp. S150]